MKKCKYCGKEISYQELYCCDECQAEDDKFYEFRDKMQKLFSFINGIFVLTIGISILLFAFDAGLGLIVGSGSLIVLGVLYFFLPFPAEAMIHKHQLKKSIYITKIIAVILLFIGSSVLFLHLIGVL